MAERARAPGHRPAAAPGRRRGPGRGGGGATLRGAGVAALLVAGFLPCALAAQNPGNGSGAATLRQRVEAGFASGRLWARGRRLTAEAALPAFYLARDFEPAWLDGGGAAARLDELVEAIEGAALDGLDPADYHLAALRDLVGGVREGSATAADLVDLELLASDAFMVVGSHLLQGRVDPVRVRAEWLADRRGADMESVLAAALDAGDVAGALDRLRPRQERYDLLRRALQRLRRAADAGGWPRVDAGATLRAGDSGGRVAALRRRLEASGDLAAGQGAGSPGVFDRTLEEAVLRFQRRHGLDADGAVGAATVEALNVPVEERVRQVMVNLERWRWMPEELGATHLLVNIPAFSVAFREDGETVARHRAIVGLEYRQTPVFSAVMTYLVLAPYWHVPPGIAAKDKFPLIRRDPSYLGAQRMRLFDARTNRPVDPASVDWSALTASRFVERYRLRQDPGPLNALGAVKFMFPNRWNVYLHDTPSRELFERGERAFSSGCIRIERPLELAERLLRGSGEWDGERIRRVVAAGVETTVTLPAPVPVHVQYWTAFVDEDGVLNFRRDLYGRDPAVLAALASDPPLDGEIPGSADPVGAPSVPAARGTTSLP